MAIIISFSFNSVTTDRYESEDKQVYSDQYKFQQIHFSVHHIIIDPFA